MVNEGVNFALGKEALEFGVTSWDGNIECEVGIEKDLECEIQCLKGKIDSFNTTSLERKQVLVAKS